MRMALYDVSAGKRPVNLTINSDLIEKAREAGLNLSALAEEAMVAALTRMERARWKEEIHRACMAHDAYLAEYGSLSDAIWAAEADE